ncbi:type II secretion system F family protein [Oscillospiraceae bacterium WX1]
MAAYIYTAVDRSGRNRKGTIEADTKERARELLKNDGLVALAVNDQNLLNKEITFDIGGKPKSRDMSIFCRQFVSIVGAGVTIIEALGMLSEQTENKTLKKAILETKLAVEKGESLAGAMRQNEKVFSGMLITMVEAGEASGSLEVSFTRMADQFEKEARLKALIKKASIYPAVVAVVAVAVVIAMLTFVVPTFQQMFADLGTKLPGITLFVVALSKFMQSYWYIVVLTIILLVVFLNYFKTTDAGMRVFGKIAMKLPLFGKLTVKTASSRLARTLSTLLAAGLPLINALEITANTMTNIFFKEAILNAKEDVTMGTSLSEPLVRGGLFPPLVCHMLKIGEESGNIEAMLSKLADYYDEEVEIATQSLMAALEPAIIIFLAGVIGTIIISVILPMAQMYSGLQNI